MMYSKCIMRFRTDLESMILAALVEKPLHGYGIVRAIRTRSEGVLKLGEGQLYPILHRLEEDALVSGDWEIQDGRPPRKVYSLTEAGATQLVERKKEWKLFSSAVGNVLGEPKLSEAPGNA